MAKHSTKPESDVDILRLYLSEIGKHPLLTKDEEVRLAQEFEAGREASHLLAQAEPRITSSQRARLKRAVRQGERARQIFINANLRLVVSMARKRMRRLPNMNILELIQEGNIGLIRAVDKFDWRKGFKFSTYAAWWIRQAMQRSESPAHLLSVPYYINDKMGSIHAIQGQLTQALKHEPTTAELAQKLGWPTEDVEDIMARVNVQVCSLDEPLGQDEEATLHDFVGVEDDLDPFLGPMTVNSLIDGAELSPLREEAVRRYYIDGETLCEIGEAFGVTRQAVSNKLKQARRRIGSVLAEAEE